MGLRGENENKIREDMNIVIGSGHAGIACAVTLVEAGLHVTLLDGGVQLEPSTEALVNTMSRREKDQWTRAELDSIKGGVSASAKGVQLKRIFGSDFPFREANELLPRKASGVGHLTPSLAVGGFSNVWGAAALPFSTRDLQGWPISSEDLDPFYRSVTRFMPLTGAEDDLRELFPIHTVQPDSLARSKQAERMYASLQRRRDSLKQRGFIFGEPRLAVRGGKRTTQQGAQCRYCGLCLFGCPYGLIYSTNETLAYLKTFKNFHYIPDIVIEHISEGQGQITVRGAHRLTTESFELCGTAAFLGAGVLGSSRILMRSLNMYDTPVQLKVSEYFMLPLLSLLKTARVSTEALHTMAQIFIEFVDPLKSGQSSHMQVYTYSEIFAMGLYHMVGPLRPLLKMFESEILGRLSVIQGYIHSDDSSSIELTLSRRENCDLLTMQGLKNPVADIAVKKLARKLSRALLPSGIIPVLPMLNVGTPGEGRHAGGSFPMRLNPKFGETDVYGRPCGFERLHVVDATVFPTVPASTITFTAMANAQRIAAHAVAEQRAHGRVAI